MSESLKISTRGQGPELVLLHGWAMHSGIWGGVVDVLASEYRVNLVDLPGHGVNRHVPLSRDLNEVAKLILSELPPAVWIGWSLGGLVTLAAALQQPQRVHKIILVAATPCFSKQADWEFGVSIEARQAFADGLETDFEETLKQFYVQCFGAAWVDESLHRLGRSAVQDNLPNLPDRHVNLPDCNLPDRHVMHTGLHLLYNNNLLADLQTCKVPMLFLGGTRDRTIRAESFELAAAMLPSASSCLIRGAGHVPFISHQDRFVDIIHGFLRGGQLP